MSRLAKYNALSAEIKRCEREQAFLGYGGGVLDPWFVGTMKFGDDFSDGDDDDDDNEYPQPPGLTKEEEMKRLRDTGIEVYDEDGEDGGDWDDEYLENHEQPRNITKEQIEALLQEFTPASYIPNAGNHSVSLTEKELRDIGGGGDAWPI